MKKLINALLKLIEVARVLGLDEYDLNNAKDFLTHNEFGLCFDTIITQMYEYDIEIDNDVYNSIAKIGEGMNLGEENYSFMRELIRDENKIPKSVKDELARIIANFIE
uniref:MafI family immunity protein n=1 Tax=Pedobacter schmidteae TaxID=2201271 RepID=UPI000EB3729A|nr:MafI family immunity protein [Pedobacter schmidteae]